LRELGGSSCGRQSLFLKLNGTKAADERGAKGAVPPARKTESIRRLVSGAAQLRSGHVREEEGPAGGRDEHTAPGHLETEVDQRQVVRLPPGDTAAALPHLHRQDEGVLRESGGYVVSGRELRRAEGSEVLERREDRRVSSSGGLIAAPEVPKCRR
jgi:hypothetical protein